MREIDRILQKIEKMIVGDPFESLETEKIELKDLSSNGEWKELYKTACAFLNTEGGIIVVGIKEKDNKYVFTGFNADNEPKIKELKTKFSDKEAQVLNLEAFFPAFEIKPFLDGQVCLVYVERLSEDKRFVYYAGKPYERIMTGDHEISQQKIDRQEELKKELEDAKELELIANATLAQLDVDRLNDYIVLLNRDIKVESLKADIPTALPFLSKKSFVRGDKPTLLGMLVCGSDPYHWVGGRCQVDCFVDSDTHIAQNKQVLKDNIIPLMESAIGFVFKNIAVGVSFEGGGTNLPEYPEKLMREVVNNALAHRDYASEKFVNLIIKPNTHIEIRNPGSFRADQKLTGEKPIKIRRIIPNPKPRNPKLADILKTFDRWEGRGLGMASLTNACLNNQIDVPYFIFQGTNDISLYVPKGKVLNEEMEQWLTGFSGWIYRQTDGRGLSAEAKTVLAYFYKSEELNRQERYSVMLTPDNNHFEVIADLEEHGLIEKIPGLDSVHPVFIVNRILAQKDFYNHLRAIFGGSFDELDQDYKDILEAIYLHNTYSFNSQVNAKEIGIFIYTRKHKIVRNFRDYDNYLRKVRGIINILEKKGFVQRADGNKPRYVVNKSFERTRSLFD